MTSSTDMKYSVPAGSSGYGCGGGGGGGDMESYPSAARIKREAEIRSQTVTNIGRAMDLRLKAVQLAAQFKSDDPMKLAREIYKFISDTEV